MAERSQSRQLTNRTVVIIAFVMGGAGLVLLFASVFFPSRWSQISAFVSQLGGLLLATGLVTLAWEQWGRRNFASEVMEMANLSTDLMNSGIKQVTDQYLSDVVWSELFVDVRKLDIVVAYANTWRNTYRQKIVQAASEPSACVRVFLPDPDDDQTMRNLAQRFDQTPAQVAAKVREAIEDFKSMSQPGGSQVHVRLRAGDAMFSCYRFGAERAVISLYSHQKRRTPVPTFVVKGGSMFRFIEDEIKAIDEQSHDAP